MDVRGGPWRISLSRRRRRHRHRHHRRRTRICRKIKEK